MWHGQRVGSLWPYSRISRPELLLFLSSSSSVVRTSLSGPRSRPTTTQKNLVAPGIEPGTSGSIARNSEHQTSEVVNSENVVVPGMEPGTSVYVARNSDH
jgi:hypothetical protein